MSACSLGSKYAVSPTFVEYMLKSLWWKRCTSRSKSAWLCISTLRTNTGLLKSTISLHRISICSVGCFRMTRVICVSSWYFLEMSQPWSVQKSLFFLLSPCAWWSCGISAHRPNLQGPLTWFSCPTWG